MTMPPRRVREDDDDGSQAGRGRRVAHAWAASPEEGCGSTRACFRVDRLGCDIEIESKGSIKRGRRRRMRT